MRYLVFLCALGSCAAADLAHRLDALMAGSAVSGMGVAGIRVVDLRTGQSVYSRNDALLFLPASNMKLLTAALALQRLGPDYRFTTRVLAAPGGDLALIGGGDPSLSSRTYPYLNSHDSDARPAGPQVLAGPLQAVEEIADSLLARGIRRIDGDIVGDDRKYPWKPSPPSWTSDDRANSYGAPVSALTLNDNVVAVRVIAGSRSGDPAKLATPFEYLTFQNEVITGPPGGAASIDAQPVPGSNQWVLTGAVAQGSEASIEIPVADPADYAAAALYDALTRRGVSIRGRPLARHRGPEIPYATPIGEEVASRVSPPLTELVETMLKLSQNLHAELLFREAGRMTQGDGTNNTGLAALAAFLKERGAGETEWRAEDGSGLSRNDLLTPRLIVDLLARQYHERGGLWTTLLPSGGADGALEHRLCCAAQGRGIRAKTGTLSRALALSGYADSPVNGRLAFSILVNNFSAPSSEVRQWIDKIAAELLE